ncbi:MAG: hypothetical protein RSF67_06180, partial [Clostridia bacterium]
KEYLIGKEFNDDLIKELNDNNIEFRVIKKDGKYYMITCDFKLSRFNIELENNIITNIILG